MVSIGIGKGHSFEVVVNSGLDMATKAVLPMENLPSVLTIPLMFPDLATSVGLNYIELRLLKELPTCLQNNLLHYLKIAELGCFYFHLYCSLN